MKRGYAIVLGTYLINDDVTAVFARDDKVTDMYFY